MFWASYAIIVGFQLIVNGILTGQRLVVYSPHAIVGGATPQFLGDWHVAYAPFEDLLFGFSLVLQTLAGGSGGVRDCAADPVGAQARSSGSSRTDSVTLRQDHASRVAVDSFANT